MNDKGPEHPFASPREVVDEQQQEYATITPGIRIIDGVISFLLGLSLMLLLCQMLPFWVWAENARSFLPHPEGSYGDDNRMWGHYYIYFCYGPAFYWIGVFLASIIGTIVTFRFNCSWHSILKLVILFPMGAVGIYIALEAMGASL